MSFEGGNYDKAVNRIYAVNIDITKSKILTTKFLCSFLLRWMGAAKPIIYAKQRAVTGVRTGAMFSHQGRMTPAAPCISAIPIKRTW
jgi:hypothetical protein